MKRIAIKIAVILMLLAGALFAVTLSIDIPANDIPRVQEAFGSIYNLGHPASQAEVTYYTRQWIIQSTQDYERRKNMATFTPPPLEMQPSPTPTPTPGGLKTAPAKAAAPTATPKKKK